MKNNLGWWMTIGLLTGIATAVFARNFPAGLCIGSATGLLLTILTNLEVDRKIRN